MSFAESHSSVSSIADLRAGGCWFDPRLGQYSFQGFMIVTESFLCHRCQMFRQWFCGKAVSGLENSCAEYRLKEFKESMDRCTGHHNITEILLKNGKKHHTINQFYVLDRIDNIVGNRKKSFQKAFFFRIVNPRVNTLPHNPNI